MNDTNEQTNPGTPSTLAEVRALRRTVADLANAVGAVHADLTKLIAKFDEHIAQETVAQAEGEKRIHRVEFLLGIAAE